MGLVVSDAEATSLLVSTESSSMESVASFTAVLSSETREASDLTMFSHVSFKNFYNLYKTA